MKKEEQRDLETVITFLEGDVDKKKIINYINEYLLGTKNKS